MAEHPRAGLALALGLLALVMPLVGPIAWFTGHRVVRDIEADPGRPRVSRAANLGRLFGVAGTGILVAIVALGLLTGTPVQDP